MNSKMRIIHCLTIVSLSVCNFSFSCEVMLSNDSQATIMITETEGKYAHVLQPGEQTLIGSQEFHANFRLFEQTSQGFQPRYLVTQKLCNAEKHQVIAVSDIIHNSGSAAEFFNVTELNSQASAKPSCCQHK